MTPAPRIPRSVWLLGFVSLLMDTSSELIHGLLPVFMVSALGASALAVGFVEGVAESTALVVKVFSGTLSDFLGKRKALAIAGYGLAAFSKPLFALASSIHWVLAARFLDRIGKGIRGAPRDALVADLTPPEIRGAAYGLRQALDTVGALLGPLLGFMLMLVWAGDFRTVFWFATIPAVLCVALLVLGVDDPPPTSSKMPRFAWRSVAALGPACWAVIALGSVFSLARFSEAFLLLRAQERGLPDAYAPLVLVVMNAVYALCAYPAGKVADRVRHDKLLAAGICVLFAADVVLAEARGLGALGVGVALWGLHMGLTQGLFATMVADAAPSALRGSAFGFFNLAGGVALVAASVLAGWIWEALGPAFTFYGGAALAALALLLLGLLRFRAPR